MDAEEELEDLRNRVRWLELTGSKLASGMREALALMRLHCDPHHNWVREITERIAEWEARR